MGSLEARARRPLTLGNKGVLAVVIMIAVLQLAIPATLLIAGPTPIVDDNDDRYRFAWQMFTTAELKVRYTLTSNHGPSREVDPERIDSIWEHANYGPVGPGRLCEAFPDARSVTRSVSDLLGRPIRTDHYKCP
jgi:hypothetical protein